MQLKICLRNHRRHCINYVLCALLLATVPLHTATAQSGDKCKGSDNKKAEKLFAKAENYRKSKKEYRQIKEAYQSVFEEDSSFAEAYLSFANFAYQRKDYETATFAYHNYIKYCSQAKGRYYYRRARSAYLIRDYDRAIDFYSEYLDRPDLDPRLENEAVVNRYRSKAYSNPVSFDPHPLEGVSTIDPEYLPIISADGELCFFTRRFNITSKNSLTPRSVEKFMFARKKGESFDFGRPLPEPFNQKESNNEGGAAITLDNQRIYFTVNDKGNFDIYTSTLRNGIWSSIVPVPGKLNHPVQWDSQPTVSPDAKTLIFASYRDSINQTSDLFESKLLSDGTWSAPIRLPDIINSKGNEKSPFLHSDNVTLYFASDGHLGMGGFDIYMSKRGKGGSWSKPVGLGYPINTETDEVGFFVNTDGDKGYFASNKLNGSGGYDIYEFDLDPKIKPEKVLLISGNLRDENDNIPLNARIELRNVQTKETVELEYDTLTGRYASVMLFDNDYIMTVKKKGFGFVSSYFKKEDSLSSVRKVDMNLKEIEVGEHYKLNNILFEFNSAELNDVSRTVIKSFKEFLDENPEMRVEIQGHTDDVGSEIDNVSLSEARAKEVYNYLLELGVDQKLLSYKGYGESMPVASNNDEEGRSLNRRTEFVIIAK